VLRDGTLRRDGGRDRIFDAAERDTKSVALRVHFPAVIYRELGPKEPPMLGEHVRIARSEPLDHLRRTIDVGEEEGDRATW
jgi:hypothetical protein